MEGKFIQRMTRLIQEQRFLGSVGGNKTQSQCPGERALQSISKKIKSVSQQAKPRSFPSMKLINRFRKFLLNFFFDIPHRDMRPPSSNKADYYYHEGSDPPKMSCDSNSYYSSLTHYNEAMADCIEFCKRSYEEDQLATAFSCGPNLVDDSMA